MTFFPDRWRPLATSIFDTIITEISIFKRGCNILKRFQGDGRDLSKDSTSIALASQTHRCGDKIAKVGEILTLHSYGSEHHH
jgi:hypothetical protein